MTNVSHQTDLFGETAVFQGEAAPHQAMMFDEPIVYKPPRPVHTKDSIRELLTSLIQELRAMNTLLWDAQTLRGHRAMAPYMAEWLKNGEGEGLLAEFRAELVRLGEEPVHRQELYDDGAA